MKSSMRMIVMLITLSLLNCGVPKKEHNAVVDQLAQRNADYAALEQQKQDAEESFRSELARLENEISELEAQQAQITTALDEANATVSMYESKTGGLEKALRVTKADIEDLKKQRAAALRRLREYRDLARRLAGMIESGQLSVKVRNSKMVIEMSNAVLFDPGKTEVKPDGVAALKELGEVLKTLEGRTLLVAGHTDNVPIRVSGFESNWELSTARASKVLHLLQEVGVAPQKLAAAGYGEFDPIASNETEESRALNRRTEIVLMPRIDELPELPDDLFGDKS